MARLEAAPLSKHMRPTREHATSTGQTYMVTSSTWGRRSLFQNERWAALLIATLYHYRGSAYLLHEFVIMPDHIYILLTPKTSLEKAVQFIKGGFSYRAKKELGSNMEVWQKGFSDHRVRDANDYRLHQIYIQQNPVRKNLCGLAEEYPYSSACGQYELAPAPQGLKPSSSEKPSTARLEGAPFQSKPVDIPERGNSQGNGLAGSEGTPVHVRATEGTREGLLFLDKIASGRTEAAPREKKQTA
jgi:putative transposase